MPPTPPRSRARMSSRPSIHAGCSASPGPPPGAPQAAVVAAVKASISANLPRYDLSKVVISCPAGWDNSEVRVQLHSEVASFFGGVFGGGPLSVNVASGAVNGQSSANAYSVIQLDPSNLSWPNGRRGCPSFLLSGGPSATFDSAIYINSACKVAERRRALDERERIHALARAGCHHSPGGGVQAPGADDHARRRSSTRSRVLIRSPRSSSRRPSGCRCGATPGSCRTAAPSSSSPVSTRAASSSRARRRPSSTPGST